MIFTAKFIVEILGTVLFIVVFIIMCVATNTLRKLHDRIDIVKNFQDRRIRQEEEKQNKQEEEKNND